MRRTAASFFLLAIAPLAALLAILAPAAAQVPGGGPVAYLYCYSGTVPTAPTSWAPCSASNPLVVSATITPSGTQNVNLTQILSAAPSLTNPLWVFPATGATFPVSLSGNTAVVGPTADGSPATTPPVLVGGTSDGTATGTVDVWKVDATGLGYTSDANTLAMATPVVPATATATKGALLGCQYNSTTLAFTNGQQGQVGCGPNGGVAIQDGQAIASVSVTSATTLFTVADTSGYGSISIQVTSAGVGTITYETSEDGTTWVVAAGTPPNNTGTTSAMVTTSTAVGQFNFNTYGKMFRARVSAYTSGTMTVQGTLRKDVMPRASIGIGGNVSVAGTVSEAGSVGSGMLPTIYEGRTTNKTAVTTGQYVRPIATSIGAAVNKPFQVPELDWSYPAAAGGISNTTAVTMVGAAGAGIRNYLTAIQLSAPTLGAATEVAVRDGAGGTVIWRGYMSTAGGNQSVNLSSPIKSTANTLLEVVTLTATITGAVYVNAQGYQAP